MWPRTPEEHARGRNTGFVCFMNRDDAQEAMEAYQERDPLRTGRRLWLRWGKNVKKVVRRASAGGNIPIVHKNADTMNAEASLTNCNSSNMHEKENNREHKANNSITPTTTTTTSGGDGVCEIKKAAAPTIDYDETIHASAAINVIPPTDEKRLEFITTVASFVAKDGNVLEKRLLEREGSNPLFSFLRHDCTNTNERVYYRWRVYAFTQGDGVDSWRVDPFIMIQPNGRFWIPPPIDKEKALREKMEKELKENRIRVKQERRRKGANNRHKDGTESSSETRNVKARFTRLHAEDLAYWNFMIDTKLCISRDAICEVMAFCFDKSHAAQHISQLLKDVLMDNRKGVSVDTKISRLYLMSDILFNSQQPGVRNAFKYRDAIEGMAKEVFTCLGSHGKGTAGRMTMNKLRNSVLAVLDAWTKWSVYNTAFLNQLEALFEGKPIPTEEDVEDKLENVSSLDSKHVDAAKSIAFDHGSNIAPDEVDTVKENKLTKIEEQNNPTSIWLEKSDDVDEDNLDGEDLDENDMHDGLVEIDEDLDGESLHDSDLEDDEV